MNNKFSLTDKLTEIDGKFLDECYERRSRRAIRRKNIVKYSSLAASVVIVITISLAATLPVFRNTPVVDPVDTSSGVVETSPGETEGDKEIGGYVGCPVHAEFYHLFSSGAFDKYIDSDELSEWIQSNWENKDNMTDGCNYGVNLYDLIHHFDISREELEDVYFNGMWHTAVWNFDVLYSDDPSVADEYYRDKHGFYDIIDKRAKLVALKGRIALDNWDTWSALYGDTVPTTKHSMKYLVELFDIPRDKLESYVTQWEDKDTYDYNVDALYALVDGTATIEDPTPIKEDAFFCGFEDLYIE